MSQYWNQQFEPFNNGLRTIGSGIARLPMMRAMAAQRAQMGNYYQAHAGEEQAAAEEASAKTGLTQAQTDALVKKGQLVEMLQKNAPLAMRAMATGKTDDPSIDEFTGATSALTGENKGDIEESMRKGIGTLLASQGQIGQAAGIENPVSVANNAATIAGRAALPAANQVIVPNGGTLVDRGSGQPLTSGGVTLEPGATRFAPQIASAVPLTQVASGQPVQPKSSAVDNTIASTIAKAVLANNTDGSGTITNTPTAIGGQLSTALKQFMPASANAPTGASVTPTPQPQHVAYLLQHPDTAAMFDAKFGQGSSAAILKSAQTPQAIPISMTQQAGQ